MRIGCQKHARVFGPQLRGSYYTSKLFENAFRCPPERLSAFFARPSDGRSLGTQHHRKVVRPSRTLRMDRLDGAHVSCADLTPFWLGLA